MYKYQKKKKKKKKSKRTELCTEGVEVEDGLICSVNRNRRLGSGRFICRIGVYFDAPVVVLVYDRAVISCSTGVLHPL